MSSDPHDARDAIRPGASARDIVARAKRLSGRAADALETSEQRRREARVAYEAAREEVVDRELATMPIKRLRETTQGGVRLGAIERAGITTVGAAAKAGAFGLQRIPGVGPHSASQVIAAARQLEHTMKENLWLRFEPDVRPRRQGALLQTLHAHEVAERAVGPLRDQLEPLAARIEELRKPARRGASRVRMFFSGPKRRQEGRDALRKLHALVEAPENVALDESLAGARQAFRAKTPSVDALWRDYEKRVAAYNGLLIEVGELAPDREASEGFVPTEIAERVHEQALDTSLLAVSLRGYQAFGAKFALAQRKAMLGDEMGLGKTIEALAAMCHLSTKGATHFLVVCPASVLVNWLHEVERHSDLAAVRLHGGERTANFRIWNRRGGVGITTYGSLHWLYEQDFDVSPALLVVDEAHYIKNPGARRTHTVRDFIGFAERTLFLTGTPLENRVDEFRTLIRHLKPSVASKVSAVDGLAGAAAFRSAVATVYLRRNQEDVLQELPPRIETEEWVELRGDDFASYRDAVESGNFMAMRQAAYDPATTSGAAKLSRLADLVAEATANDRKVVVFSFFRRVLDIIAELLDDVAMGPLTGSVAPGKRQKLVDDFTAARRARALVSQIEAGGIGLNIQAASVVILAEPQWKPSSEEQAIARCHRMGQARPVDVHRLLAADSVDQRMLEVLAEKSSLFDEYVRRSALKDASPDAVDISDLAATRDVVDQAETERRIIEVERQRLGVAAAPA